MYAICVGVVLLRCFAVRLAALSDLQSCCLMERFHVVVPEFAQTVQIVRLGEVCDDENAVVCNLADFDFHLAVGFGVLVAVPFEAYQLFLLLLHYRGVPFVLVHVGRAPRELQTAALPLHFVGKPPFQSGSFADYRPYYGGRRGVKLVFEYYPLFFRVHSQFALVNGLVLFSGRFPEFFRPITHLSATKIQKKDVLQIFSTIFFGI